MYVKPAFAPLSYFPDEKELDVSTPIERLAQTLIQNRANFDFLAEQMPSHLQKAISLIQTDFSSGEYKRQNLATLKAHLKVLKTMRMESRGIHQMELYGVIRLTECYAAFKNLEELLVEDESEDVTKKIRETCNTLTFFMESTYVTKDLPNFEAFDKIFQMAVHNPQLMKTLNSSTIPHVRVLQSLLAYSVFPKELTSHKGFHKKLFFESLKDVQKQNEESSFISYLTFNTALRECIDKKVRVIFEDSDGSTFILRKTSRPDNFVDGKICSSFFSVTGKYSKTLFEYNYVSNHWISSPSKNYTGASSTLEEVIPEGFIPLEEKPAQL